MQAIQTKFIGPTNTKGSRVKATCWLGSVTVSWDHSQDSESNHREAIAAMVNKLNSGRGADSYKWEGVALGSSVDGKGYTAIITLTEK